MKYELTAHAKIALGERQIPERWLDLVLSQPERSAPDRTDPNLTHCLARIREYDDRVLRVVVDARRNPARVVTAYFDRSMRGKL